MAINSGMIDKINSRLGAITNSPPLKALMAGLMSVFPVTIVGSFASILKGLQISSYQNFLTSTGIMNILDILVLFSINLTALYAVFGIAYAYAREKKQEAISAGIIALFCFLLITPFTATTTEYGTIDYSLPFNFLGGQGMFSAIIVGLIVGSVYSFIKKKGWTIKLPESVPPVVSSSFSGIIPGLILAILFGTVSTLFTHTSFGSLHQAIYSILQTPLVGISSSIWSLLFLILLGQLLWFVGVHGPLIIISVMMPLWISLDLQNQNAFLSGQPLPNITGAAFYTVTTYGGTALGLGICMLLFAKSKRYKTLGKLSFVPALFGITEPLIFGTPLILNLKTFVPAVFLPVLSALLSYFAMASGIVPRLSGVSLPQGTPIIVQGFLQGSWIIGLLQLILIIIWTLCWFPFFKKLDNEARKDEESESLQSEQTIG